MLIIIIILLIIWELYWKANALWLAAQYNDKLFFLSILIINSAGILPLYYLYKNNYFNNIKQKDQRL